MTSQLFLRLVPVAVSFPVRHRSRLLPCGRIRGFQELAEELSATHLLGCRREGLLGLVCVVPQPRAGEQALRGRVEASERGEKWGVGRGMKLVTEDSKPSLPPCSLALSLSRTLQTSSGALSRSNTASLVQETVSSQLDLRSPFLLDQSLLNVPFLIACPK